MELRSENLSQKRKIQKLTQENKALVSAGGNVVSNSRDEESSEDGSM